MPHSFFDTNILIYAARPNLEPRDEPKRPIAIALLDGEEFVTSGQVLAEFYHNTVRKGDSRLSHEEAELWLDRIADRPCASVDAMLVSMGASFSARYRISYWDGAMLAAAQELGATTFYSEDLHHGQRYGDVTVVNPFRSLSH